MAFGFRVGDFLAVGNLAWIVYRSCKGMTQEFQEVSRQALTAHTLIKELDDEVNNAQSLLNTRGASKQGELVLLVQNLEKVLKELKNIVEKYQGLARRERRIWNQLRLASEDLDKIRDKLTFHITAINAFMESLSRGTLAQMERVLVELMSEIREGRRPPYIAPPDDANDISIWKELESELAEDGISRTDVANHKVAIRVFLQSRLHGPVADNPSLDEVASFIGSSDEKEVPGSLTQIMDAMSVSSHGSSCDTTISSVGKSSLVTADSQQYYSAVELLEGIDPIPPTAGPSISFAASTRFPTSFRRETKTVAGIDKRLQQSVHGSSMTVTNSSVYRYRHSLDASHLDPHAIESSQKQDALENPAIGRMVLIIDPSHSSKILLSQQHRQTKGYIGVSKMAHAYMRSLIKNSSSIRAQLDTVRSTGWQVYKSHGFDTYGIDTLMREVLTSKKVESLMWRTQNTLVQFMFQDLFEFDHIIYLNSPHFLQYLEDNIQKIAAMQSKEGMQGKSIARLTRYDLPSSVQTPESMSRKASTVPEMFRNHQKLALDEILGAVQRFTLDFLEREYGLRKTSQGFEKMTSRRPSRSSSLSPVDRIALSVSSE
ncbi:hypothetical protein N7G274_004493 [Stereocaulon virgatum]|uniref:Fungal N-terminal domain-containing protein n=1 Tax=Stereocaulon virgatum TaxID=373712 RepID=A0ABR4AA26_9LECA